MRWGSISIPTAEPTQELTPAPTPTPPVNPGLFIGSQSQPQCEFGVNSETGLCNTEDIPSELLPPTPEPTTTLDEDFSIAEEPEEEVEKPEEEIVEGPAEEPD
jgi:hypothetical protein